MAPDNQAPNRTEAGTFAPGTSGNPGGRPKGTVSLRARLRARLTQEGRTGADLADELLDELLQIALRRRKMSARTRLAALTFLFEQLDGKAIQSVEVSDPRAERMDDFISTLAGAYDDALAGAEDEAPPDGPTAS